MWPTFARFFDSPSRRDSRTWRREYQEAIRAERKAWKDVEGCLPGTARFDQAAWDRWCEASRHTDAVARQLLSRPQASGHAR